MTVKDIFALRKQGKIEETYLNYINACSLLQDAFGKIKLDVVTKKGLSPYIGEAILNEVEYV